MIVPDTNPFDDINPYPDARQDCIQLAFLALEGALEVLDSKQHAQREVAWLARSCAGARYHLEQAIAFIDARLAGSSPLAPALTTVEPYVRSALWHLEMGAKLRRLAWGLYKASRCLGLPFAFPECPGCEGDPEGCERCEGTGAIAGVGDGPSKARIEFWVDNQDEMKRFASCFRTIQNRTFMEAMAFPEAFQCSACKTMFKLEEREVEEAIAGHLEGCKGSKLASAEA